ncbi:MAG: hypothetical protein ACO3C5_10185 [Ilumatobacteraceae bacterium]
MKTSRTFIASLLIAATTFVASPAHAADIPVIGTDSRDEACAAAFGGSAKCFYVNGKLTATISNGAVTATNPITAAVGDTITLKNQSGMHNMVFCKAGTTVNGWKCGDPITNASDPGGARTSAAGAPTAIPESGGTLKIDAAGDYYFWCGLGSHRFGGQYGKLTVTGTSTAATTATTKPATTTTKPKKVSTVAAVAPTMTLKKSSGKITATGRATAKAKVTLQKKSGTKWVAVARTTATSTGTYTISAKAEARTTTYRVLVCTRTSTTRRA